MVGYIRLHQYLAQGRKPECAAVKVAEQGTMGLVTLDDAESPSSGLPGSPVS